MDAQADHAAAIRVDSAGSVTATVSVEGITASLQVGAGAECASGAGNDDGFNVIVGVGSIECVDHFALHFAVEGVEALGTIEGYGQNAVGNRI